MPPCAERSRGRHIAPVIRARHQPTRYHLPCEGCRLQRDHQQLRGLAKGITRRLHASSTSMRLMNFSFVRVGRRAPKGHPASNSGHTRTQLAPTSAPRAGRRNSRFGNHNRLPPARSASRICCTPTQPFRSWSVRPTDCHNGVTPAQALYRITQLLLPATPKHACTGNSRPAGASQATSRFAPRIRRTRPCFVAHLRVLDTVRPLGNPHQGFDESFRDRAVSSLQFLSTRERKLVRL